MRIGVDAPYAAAKALLIQEVAAANRCESVWSDDLGFATVLGFPADLAAVELLHTSLLVQATAAMLRGRGERGRAGGRRTKGYDESFLNAFALRVGDRLRSASAAAAEELDDDRLAGARGPLRRRPGTRRPALSGHHPAPPPGAGRSGGLRHQRGRPGLARPGPPGTPSAARGR
ncbi:hypothetical protein V2I01_17315 [Micromonospora sp. BRA006-A]|nr:hypothetical protein [Micromonospora sp. BRA006-A]